MSLYKKSNRLIHFVHIPKTGGTSIRKLLDKNQWENVTPEIHPSLSHKIYSFPQHKTAATSIEICGITGALKLMSNLQLLGIHIHAVFHNYYQT